MPIFPGRPDNLSLPAGRIPNQGKAGGLRWTGKRQPKEDQYPAQMKLRYEKQLRKEETVNGICSGPEGS